MHILNNMEYINSLSEITGCLSIKKGSILVTGASGLIGSCIVDLLSYSNTHNGSNYDIFVTGRNLKNLKERFNGSDIHYIEVDFTKDFNFSNYKFDYILHAASNADPVNYAKYPVETMLVNINATKKLLDYCVSRKNTRLLIMSTFEVYGMVENSICSEDDYGRIDFNMMRSMYPESKRSAELLARSYMDEYGVNMVITRLCSIYGPTVKITDSKAQNQFIRNILSGQNIVLKSKGSQRRSYCHVIDAVSAILTVLFKGKTGEAYNISNTRSIVSIAEVATILADQNNLSVVYDIPSDLEKKGFSKPMDCILDDAKIRQLGWSDKYSIEDGLHNTVSILRSITNE